jgi:hypothetical protein
MCPRSGGACDCDAAGGVRHPDGREKMASVNGRLHVVMSREHGLQPPRIIARVGQRQRRGAGHLHAIYLCRTPDERERMRAWVEAYRRHAETYVRLP